MKFDEKKPYMIIYDGKASIIIQDGKKYTLNGEPIEDESTTTETADTKDSSKKQPRSNKQS